MVKRLAITNDFKNSTKRKVYEAEYFVSHYKDGDYIRIFIDREDDRRQVITLNRERFYEFKKAINLIA